MSVGLIGIGRMGEPITRRLLQAGQALTVWSRTNEHAERLRPAGARIASAADVVFAQSQTVLMMLRNEAAVDSVLARDTPRFAEWVHGRRLVQMGTVAPTWSQRFAEDVALAGGSYVEAPVSGSRIPAENGQLLGMLAGDAACLDAVASLLAPVCRRFIRCGTVPRAMQLKLAVNHYLIGLVCTLAEAVRAATQTGLPLNLLVEALTLSPMASAVMQHKLALFAAGEFPAQASIADVTHVSELVCAQAEAAGAPSPIMNQCLRWFESALARGDGDLDMAAVLHERAGLEATN